MAICLLQHTSNEGVWSNCSSKNVTRMVCTADIVLDSVIRGHYVYKTIWSPFVRKTLHLQTNAESERDINAVASIKNSVVVGHAPKEMSPTFLLFQHGGSIQYLVKLLAAESMAMDWMSLPVVL